MGNPPWACLRKKDLGWDRGVESKKVVQHVYLVGAKSIYRVAEKDKEYLRDEEEKNQNTACGASCWRRGSLHPNASQVFGFMGKEEPQDSTTYVINPGLGMAAEQGNGFCLDVIEYYKTIHFDFNNIITVCEHVTRCLKKKGYIGNNKIEKIDGFTLYPTEYFCPKNYYTNEMRMTRNTCSIHHYTSSWSSAKFTRFHVFETKIMKIFGPKVSDFFMVKLARNIYCNMKR